MKEISKYLSLADVTKSQTAISRGVQNTPGSREITNMKLTAANLHTPVTEQFLGGVSAPFTSFYRCPKLDRLVGGTGIGQHVKGEAIDFDLDNTGLPKNNTELFYWIRENLDFDQLIWEFGTVTKPDWVHASFTASRKNRKQILRAVRQNGAKIYLPF